MPAIGPSLPPQLAKRTRDEDDKPSEKRRRVLGPAPPRSRSSSPDNDIGPAPPTATVPKPTRVLGPSAPPAGLSEQPPHSPSDDSDSDSGDDGFGPAPPSAGVQYHSSYDDDQLAGIGPSVFDTDERYIEQAKKVERDEWMTQPPTQDDLAARMDPTKLRARKFNSGKGARAPGGEGIGVWTETPEQKLKRLQNEALGISAPANASSTTQESKNSKEEEVRFRKMKERVEKSRGSSLMDQHKERGTGKEKEDDPSKRAFDYEKDMGMGMKIGHKQRNEMLKKAKGFGERFSSGSFL